MSNDNKTYKLWDLVKKSYVIDPVTQADFTGGAVDVMDKMQALLDAGEYPDRSYFNAFQIHCFENGTFKTIIFL